MYPDLVVQGEPYYASSNDCGYCHGSKPSMENGFSLQSYKDAYLEAQSDFKETGDNSSLYFKYPHSILMGCNVYSFSPQCYERLMNRGFRRSGHFLYRPDMLRTCCRMYTIRTKLEWLKPTKEHRHNVNRFVKYILNANDENSKPTSSKKSKPTPFNLEETLISAESKASNSRFYTRIGPPTATKEKFALYKKYQVSVHNDKISDVTYSGFKRFLCASPFPEELIQGTHQEDHWQHMNSWLEQPLDSSDPSIVGPVHDCYYLDGKLVAIAVLDILPNSVSSVYFIWDPDTAHLGLGTLSALREMVLTKRLGKEHYYLGYYIEDCVKMKYKGKFGGEIMDLCTRKFVKLDKLKNLNEGGLLVLHKNETSDDQIPDSLTELETVDEIGEFDVTDSRELCNIAESIYGINGGAFAKAKRVGEVLSDTPGLESFKENESDNQIWKSKGRGIFKFPLVSPGLIPLWQIKEMIDNFEMNLIFAQTRVTTDPSYGFAKVVFDDDILSDYREDLITYLRLFGVEQFKHQCFFIL